MRKVLFKRSGPGGGFLEFEPVAGADFGQYGRPQKWFWHAPAFKLKNLYGKEVSLSDFAGRVVCSTSGRPGADRASRQCLTCRNCRRKAHDRPVSIVGINPETGMAMKARDWLEKRKFTFGQLREGRPAR